MSWESRGKHGLRFYYRARRREGRIIKSCMGSGQAANVSWQLDLADRAQRKRARAQEREELAEFAAVADQVAEFCDFADLITRAALLIAGYHRPLQGSWRKRHGRKSASCSHSTVAANTGEVCSNRSGG